MAKGKHAAALFEVIHSGRYPNKPVMNTPKWWFKRNKPKVAPDDAADGGASPGDSAALDDDPTVAAEQSLHSSSSDTSSVNDPTSGRSPFDRAEAAAEQPRRSHAGNLDVAVDRDRRLITLKVSYSSAIITAFTIMVIVSLAYVVGRKMSRGPLAAIASETTDQLRAGAARPDVMNLSPPAGRQQNGPNLPRPAQTNGEQESDTTPNPTPSPGAETVTPAPTSPASSSARMVGLNYVVVQS
jgi:hypothetical protein